MDSAGQNRNDVTCLLQAVERGDSDAAESLLTLVYDELRRLAAYKMAHEAPGQTLQPTALVHEAWLKLIGVGEQKFKNQNHFIALAAEAMRRILIDRARRRKTQRHGGQCERVEMELWETRLTAPAEDDQLLAVNEALEKLEAQHPAQAQVVKLRYFGGMSNEEVAQALNVSISTVKTYWIFARAWLFDAIRNS
ncbi:MAG TPA: sigma-70 family RNA polymerase sigma factor [Candidatus Limnocylindria bacterium]|nr:sigma-70 family RNA polymerase sigma factor [Candidatus Limnocylindria bacterium]